jgi:hypothetical protein
MEINEAPEKIYIPTILVANTVRYKGEGYIEYTRTDAFIEKVCEFIKKRFYFDDSWHVEGETSISDKVIEDFKNYIKGE